MFVKLQSCRPCEAGIVIAKKGFTFIGGKFWYKKKLGKKILAGR